MSDVNSVNELSTAKLSRRNVVVGTAWAVPTILAVGAAPAMAASVPPPPEAKAVLTNIGAYYAADRGITSNWSFYLAYPAMSASVSVVLKLIDTNNTVVGTKTVFPSAPVSQGQSFNGEVVWTGPLTDGPYTVEGTATSVVTSWKDDATGTTYTGSWTRTHVLTSSPYTP